MARMRQLKITRSITSRESPSLDKYLQEIGKVKLITAEDEVELARRIKQGDTLALEKLAKANLRFVVSVAKQYQGQGLSLPDLISEGNFGLIKAAKRFDETRGFKFISYAVWWIRQQILQAIAEQSRVVRLPIDQVGSMGAINKASAKLEQEYERRPTANELAEVLDLTTEKVEGTLRNNAKNISLDYPLHEGDKSASLLDMVPSTEHPDPLLNLESSDLKIEIGRHLDKLTTREAEIIRLFFGLKGESPHGLEEIGAKFDLSAEGVRQVKNKALRKMRYRSTSALLRKYL